MSLIFFAGGECLTRHGVLVRRTSIEEEVIETFTRSGAIGWFVDSAGVLRNSDANVPRVDYLSGVPYLLLEDARTNLTADDDLTTWSVIQTPIITATVSDPAGGTGAYTVEDDNGVSVERIGDTVAFTGDAVKSVELVVRENTMPASGIQTFAIHDSGASANRLSLGISAWVAGEPTITMTTGTLLSKREIGNGYWAIYAQTTSVTAANTHEWQIFPAATAAQTGSIDVFRVMAFNDTVPSSSIMDAATTRNADTFYADFPHVPQEMTVYAKFVERGTVNLASGGVLHIGQSGSGGDPRLQIQVTGSGSYAIRHDNGTNDVTATAPATPAVGDTIELRGLLDADGGVAIGQSINGATETVTSVTAGGALASAWADTRLYVNSRGTSNPGVNAFAAIKVARGTKTLADMRAL